jgi:MFS family permease
VGQTETTREVKPEAEHGAGPEMGPEMEQREAAPEATREVKPETTREATRRLWTREFVILALANFVNASNFYLLMVITSSYAIDHFGTDSGVAGLVTGMFIVGALISRLVAGRMLGLLSYRRTLMIGLAVALAASLLYSLAPTVELFILIRVVHGFGFGIIVSAASTIVADIVPSDRIGRGMGYFQLSATLATAIGPFIAIFLSEIGNYVLIFIICSALLALTLVLVPFLRLRTITLNEEERNSLKGLRLSSIIEVPVLPVSALALLMYLSYAAIVAFLALFTREIGMPGTASWFFAIFAIVILVTRPFVSRLFDRRGLMPIIFPALAILALGFALLSQMNALAMLVIAAVVIGLGQGAIQGTTLSTVAKITPSHRKGIATTTYYLMTDVGYSLGPILSGFLIPLSGYRGLYLLMGAIILFAMVFCYVQRRSIEGTKPAE